MFGTDNVGKVVSYSRSNWSKDPYTLMSYSHIKKGGNYYTDCSDVQRPIRNKVFFAGEHTYCEFIGTTNSAFISGIIAGEAVMK